MATEGGFGICHVPKPVAGLISQAVGFRRLALAWSFIFIFAGTAQNIFHFPGNALISLSLKTTKYA